MWYIYIMEYYSAIKMNKIMPFAATWMGLEIVILRDVNETQKDNYHMILLICLKPENRKRGGTNEFTYKTVTDSQGFPDGSVVKNLCANAGDTSSIPGLIRDSGEGNDNPLQYSCLGNPVDKGPWRSTIPGVAKESDMT